MSNRRPTASLTAAPAPRHRLSQQGPFSWFQFQILDPFQAFRAALGASPLWFLSGTVPGPCSTFQGADLLKGPGHLCVEQPGFCDCVLTLDSG